ncbi:hypothetical protein [Teichococcus vastitatis]|nr:hypothetical protein [Pseudoroseomonas vastitatis]
MAGAVAISAHHRHVGEITTDIILLMPTEFGGEVMEPFVKGHGA